MTVEWWYVSLPRATFLLGVSGGVIVVGPPYVKRQLGREWADLAAAWRRGAARRGPVIIKRVSDDELRAARARLARVSRVTVAQLGR